MRTPRNASHVTESQCSVLRSERKKKKDSRRVNKLLSRYFCCSSSSALWPSHRFAPDDGKIHGKTICIQFNYISFIACSLLAGLAEWQREKIQVDILSERSASCGILIIFRSTPYASRRKHNKKKDQTRK